MTRVAIKPRIRMAMMMGISQRVKAFWRKRVEGFLSIGRKYTILNPKEHENKFRQ
jgi:hypothetical protein